MALDSIIDGGGFMTPSLLSPPLTVASSDAGTTLPQPRSRPLKLGGPKESAFIRFADESVLRIQRRFARRDSVQEKVDDAPGVTGYKTFGEVAEDADQLINLLWITGTPSLQVPYLLNLAMLLMQYLTSFAPAPRATFRILDKLDLAFASLMQGRDLETGRELPGFDAGWKVSSTERVRLKSIVDQTRLVVTQFMEQDEGSSVVDMTDTDDDELDFNRDDEDDFHESAPSISHREIGIARVYDRSVVELGDTLRLSVASP